MTEKDICVCGGVLYARGLMRGCVCVCVCLCVSVSVCVRERDRERESDRDLRRTWILTSHKIKASDGVMVSCYVLSGDLLNINCMLKWSVCQMIHRRKSWCYFFSPRPCVNDYIYLCVCICVCESVCVCVSESLSLSLSLSLTHTHTHTEREREKERETHSHTHTHTEREREGCVLARLWR